jgi:phage/plasmid-associated DNA primase
MKKEAPGILYRWMLGARDFLEQGLRTPECIREASRDMFSEVDTVGRFIDEALSFASGGFCPSEDLQVAYSRFIREIGHPDSFVDLNPLYRRLKTFPGVASVLKRNAGRVQRGWSGINVRESVTDVTL